MEAIESMRCLRRVLKGAKTGNGDVVKAIQACTFALTERGFTMLIVTCRRSGKWRKAVEIFEAMSTPKISSQGVFPNFYTYSSLISVCCNAGAWARALQVFDEMKEAAREQLELSPDAEVYSSVVCALQRGKRMRDAVAVAAEAQRQGLVLDLCGLAALVDALISMKSIREAVLQVDEVHSRGEVLPARVYNRILSECADSKDLNTCVEVFVMMQMAEVAPDEVAYCSVLRAAIAVSDLVACDQLLEEMKEVGVKINKDLYSSYRAALRA